jgi:ABC-type uncharacterized transport system auxiliary subunit
MKFKKSAMLLTSVFAIVGCGKKESQVNTLYSVKKVNSETEKIARDIEVSFKMTETGRLPNVSAVSEDSLKKSRENFQKTMTEVPDLQSEAAAALKLTEQKLAEP